MTPSDLERFRKLVQPDADGFYGDPGKGVK